MVYFIVMQMLRITQTLTICLALAATLSSPAAFAGEASSPRVTTTSRPSPLPVPYQKSADAKADVDAAIVRAKAAHKYVLLDFGGNWCADCRILAGVMELNDVRPAVVRTFEVVMIDVGRMTKNLDIAARYGVKVNAVPLVVILDPDGKFVNAGNPTALSDARSMSNQAIVDTIFGWVKAP